MTFDEQIEQLKMWECRDADTRMHMRVNDQRIRTLVWASGIALIYKALDISSTKPAMFVKSLKRLSGIPKGKWNRRRYGNR